MSLLARKINRQHWEPPGITASSDIGSDAITQSMRTSGNQLSVFEIQTEAEIKDAFLALASNLDRLEPFDLVTVDKQLVIGMGYKCIQSPGETPVDSLIDTHHDICELNYGNLGPLAMTIYDRVQSNNSTRLVKHELKELIVQAIIAELLEFSKLRRKVKEDIAELLPDS